MQQKQTFSAQTLTLSVAAAELGRAIFGAGQTGSVRRPAEQCTGGSGLRAPCSACFGQRLPSEPPGLCRKVHLCRLSALVSF